jgi:hypothetical protein
MERATPLLRPSDPLFSQRKRAERCALLAPTVYPEPVGAVLALELTWWAATGYLFGRNRVVDACMTEIEKKEHEHGAQERRAG